MRKHPRPNQRRGIVLLVALAMLGLFSILVVSYVISTGQVAAITELDQAQAREVLPVEASLEDAVAALISGSNNPHSAAYRHSLLQDLYGLDGVVLRVGNRRGGGINAMQISPDGIDVRGFLLRNLGGGSQPVSSLFKFPTSLAAWHNDGATPPDGEVNNPNLVPANVRNLDDALSGRQLTFLEGPLANMTFQIVRSFGSDNTNDPNVNADIESLLAGCAVIDLNQAPTTEIEVNGISFDLFVTASGSPGSLLYDLGDDEKPGAADFDDDGDGQFDEPDEIGYPGSDDFGYRFVINGLPFNGLGSNPNGLTGVSRNGQIVDSAAEIELQFNSRLLGAALGFNGTSPEEDEPWDVADFENIFLAWQPANHRSSRGDAAIYGGGTELDQAVGSEIIPSFHRPAVINYLMNAPILLPGENPGINRTFWNIYNGPSLPRDKERLVALARRLRRATMRPLNFDHSSGDMDGDGISADGNPLFTGSNLAPVHWETISEAESIGDLKFKLRRLAIWLANGPWDIDNDGDGLPDSIWVDLNLPTFQSATGQVIRPVIAPLIEDLDGRVNINQSGNYRQLLTRKFQASNPRQYNSDATYSSALLALNTYGRGGGVGPAEIDFSHLFDEGNGPGLGAFGPIFHTQTSAAQSNFLYTRYGNLMNTRYGGTPLDYSAAPNTLLRSAFKFPGFGDDSDPVAEHRIRDQVARIPFPARQETFSTATSVMGKSMDLSGLALERKDRSGNEIVDNAVASYRNDLNEVLNQPYENGLDDDTPFSALDLTFLLDQLSASTTLDQLLRDEVQRNPTLQNLITTESRTIDVPETSGFQGIIAIYAGKLNAVPANERQTHLDRMLAPEFRKGAKLNLNRGLGNGIDDFDDPAANLTGLADEGYETIGNAAANVIQRSAREPAFPQINAEFSAESVVKADYAPVSVRALSNSQIDFDGYDSDGDGVLDAGTDHDGDTFPDKIADGQELLARHLYCLMFMLIEDEEGGVLVPDFPYPAGFGSNVDLKNRFVARRIAQWAANAVDFRDTNAICTRLRYDPNPFDGFQLEEAAKNVVWGMERPEIEISETLAFHDKRLRRGLETPRDPNDSSLDLDGELADDEDDDPDDMKDPDSDMDQFRIPEASAFVELRSLRSPLNTTNAQPSLPAELYANNQLDLGRVVGRNNRRSPVWRLAVGEPVQGDTQKSIRWIYDAERVGEKLAGERGNTEQIDYLSVNAPNWSNPTNALNTWRQAQKVAAEVRPSSPVNGESGEFVTLTDNDFNPSNDANNGSRIQLTRFVWFANLQPSPNLALINNPRSGMTPGNVFYNPADPEDSNNPNRAMNASPLLAPGQYAVVAPRVSTTIGQRTNVTSPQFDYFPSSQRLGFAFQSGSANPARFRFNYHGLGDFDNDPETPRYWEDRPNNNVDQHYHVNAVVPIIAQALPPDLVGNSPSWSAYRDSTPADQQVAVGFNVSAPLSGPDYYPAPTHRISEDGMNDQGYPLVDGYRDYVNQEGTHHDQPFDHRNLGGQTKSLLQNEWAGVGTYQEAVGVFLQRLADPTVPWHPIDNPYLTMDLAPMDLTTFNGEGDPTEAIDRNGDGQNDEIADNATKFDGTDFTPPVQFDSRRKIPDTRRDRASTELVQRETDPSTLSSYERQIFTERSALSASFSLLRTVETSGSSSVFDFELGSLWTDDHRPNDAGIDSSYRVNQAWEPYHPGMDIEPYRQTLGFVNREYGRPIGADNGQSQDAPDVVQYGRGTPRGTSFLMPQWDDRDFQSPLDLIHIPAVSRTGIVSKFSPGTQLQDEGKRELPTTFDHLLGFEAGFSQPTQSDIPSADGWRVGRTASVTTDGKILAGDRSPFELIFDLVSTGEASYLNNRWLEADSVKFVQPTDRRSRVFNRVVEFLQPPHNYVPGLRTPGRINLNTTPDYIRKGGQFAAQSADFLDFGERPDDKSQAGSGGVNHLPVATDVVSLSSNFVSSGLFGNGAIYRSLAWAGSSFYELDDFVGRPTALGDFDRYGETVDTRFGLGFKAFIESRRGYDTALQSSDSVNSLLNPNLDYRYPTRFAGVFSTAQAAGIPSVQRFMYTKKNGVTATEGIRRRTHDMGVYRPHPDFDQRLFDQNQEDAFADENNEVAYSLNVETKPSFDPADLPDLDELLDLDTPAEVSQLRMTRANQGLFDRSLPELHKDFQHRARMPNARFENTARLKNLTTHQSNVFMIRLTVGFFVVDPSTGALGAEYENRDGEITRGQATFIVDRSVPVGFIRGETVNVDQTILYSILK